MKLELFVGIIGIMAIFGMVMMHQQAHIETFKYYGINSSVEYIKSFPDFIKAIPDGDCPTEECALSHNMNENFSYVLLPLVGFIIIMSIIFVAFLDSINNRLKSINYMKGEELGYETV